MKSIFKFRNDEGPDWHNKRDCVKNNFDVWVKQHQCDQDSYEQDRDEGVPGLPVLGREVLQSHHQPSSTADQKVEQFVQGLFTQCSEEILFLLQAAAQPEELNGVENARKDDSGVEDCKKAEKAEETALRIVSWENKDIDKVTDDSNNTGGW